MHTDAAHQAATEYVENFTTLFFRDVLAQAHATHWRRRAQDFENARPRPGDYLGQATPEQYAARGKRLAEIAQACRNAAELALITAHDEDDRATP